MTQTTTAALVTLDQRRARHAWDAVQEAKKAMPRKECEDYGGEAKKLPMRIMAAGLGHALAFICAKGADKDKKPGAAKLHEDLTDWIVKGRGLEARVPESLLESVVKGDAGFLRLATDEALAYLAWLNRFAEAENLGKEG